MKVGKIFVLLVLSVIVISCNQSLTEKVIVLQPFGDFSRVEAQVVFAKIKSIHPKAILRSNIPFPKSSYNAQRNRFRADTLIAFLKNSIGKDTVIVGLSRKDISTTKGGHQDWGVMGLGYRPGNACIISSFRLSKNKIALQFYKVVLHELGHTQGLPHCSEKPVSCAMPKAEIRPI